MSADVSSLSSALNDLSAQELSAAYRDKRLSPVEVTKN